MLNSDHEYVLSFEVLNQLQQQSIADSPTPQIKATSTCANIPEADMDGTVLVIEEPRYLVKNIEQSKPFPCSWNQITVAIAANVHLKAMSSLKIQGLAGAIMDPSERVDLYDGSGGAYHNEKFVDSKGDWDESTNGLILTVADNANLVAGREYRFVFDIYNPSIKSSQSFKPSTDDGSTAVAALVDAGTSFLPAQDLQVEVAGAASQLVLQSTLETESTSLALCSNTIVSDRKPLFLYKPQFTIKKNRPELFFPVRR